MSGSITATQGSIGGWTLDSTMLNKDRIELNAIEMAQHKVNAERLRKIRTKAMEEGLDKVSEKDQLWMLEEGFNTYHEQLGLYLEL